MTPSFGSGGTSSQARGEEWSFQQSGKTGGRGRGIPTGRCSPGSIPRPPPPAGWAEIWRLEVGGGRGIHAVWGGGGRGIPVSWGGCPGIHMVLGGSSGRGNTTTPAPWFSCSLSSLLIIDCLPLDACNFVSFHKRRQTDLTYRAFCI